ncbi:hypothetical protein ECO26H__p40016 [Escherichia coli O26:H11]|nr:hypothetical protein ECO26H__p40016 [Escherichia coli O26:H11]
MIDFSHELPHFDLKTKFMQLSSETVWYSDI